MLYQSRSGKTNSVPISKIRIDSQLIAAIFELWPTAYNLSECKIKTQSTEMRIGLPETEDQTTELRRNYFKSILDNTDFTNPNIIKDLKEVKLPKPRSI